MEDPTAPLFGVTLVMLGGDVTVKETPVLALPETVTSTLPVVAPAGTVALILELVQDEILVAAVPLKVTVLLP
jgi:hypothetical protein